jgi:hypothetical protein
MISRSQTLRRFAVLGGVLLVAARADAQLVAKSPFMAAPTAGAAAPTAGAPLEFRGTMETAGGLKVRIVDPARKAGAWLLVNERDPSFDFVVKQIDAEHDTVTVDYQGRPLTLAQHVAKVASAGVAQNFPGAAGPGGAPMPAAIAQSVVLNPTPADEQRRLDAVASEVARRRALREQASQQVSQGVPLAPQVIQQQQDLRAQQQAQQQQQNAPQQNSPNQQRGQRLPRNGRGTP